MGFRHLDMYADRPSWLTRRTTPDQRLALALAAAFVAGLMPPGAYAALAILAVIVVAGARAARMPLSALARRLGHALPFFALPALALPITVPGPPVWSIGSLTVTGPGLIRAAEVIARAGLAISAVTVLVSVTRAADLLAALDRLPLPRGVVSTLALGYRYVYLLGDEHERTLRAMNARGAGAGGFRLFSARTSALAHLFARAHERATRVHLAMVGRGYRGRFPSLARTADGSRVPTAAILVTLAAVWLVGFAEATL